METSSKSQNAKWRKAIARLQKNASWTHIDKVPYEHAYFECIGSGVKFQFFSTPVTSTCRMNMGVGVFDRYTLPVCGKNIELVCRTSEFLFWVMKVEESVNFRGFKMTNIRNFWVQKSFTVVVDLLYPPRTSTCPRNFFAQANSPTPGYLSNKSLSQYGGLLYSFLFFKVR